MKMTSIGRRLWEQYDVSFPTEERLIALLGNNGSGKTQLLNHLASYYEERGERVIYLSDDRYFELPFSMCERIYRQRVGLRQLVGVMGSYVETFELDLVILEQQPTPRPITQGKEQLWNFFLSVYAEPSDCILIIDEPEQNLSLTYQDALVRELLALTPVKQLIVATHSPSILSGNLANVIHVNACLTPIPS